MITKKEVLGQYFTPSGIVDKMLSLRSNFGSILEPSAGKGAFLKKIEKNAVGIEIDPSLDNDPRVLKTDFFKYPTSNKFDTIIGNPPYVRFNDISIETKQLLSMELFDQRSNLYLFFIAKSIEHLSYNGELIFIIPRDFLKLTSANKLNNLLFNQGTITHYYELGDTSIFSDATPNCAIIRWQKGLKTRTMATGGYFQVKNGQIYFKRCSNKKIGDFFDVKVGAVSGADAIFTNDYRGCTDMVCSTTVKDGKTKRVIYNRFDESLVPYKKRLLNRGIRKFDEKNWWEWGRKYHEKEGERIYVNGKTRNPNPFFISHIKGYDGSVLALFPKRDIDMEYAVKELNKVDWGGVRFFVRREIFIYPEEFGKRPSWILMIPQTLLDVRDYLRSIEIRLSYSGQDGRTDSANSENTIIQHIQNSGKWRSHSPNIAGTNNRHWYDIKIEQYYVDIKISECYRNDNTNAKGAIYWLLTGQTESFPIPTNKYFSSMLKNEDPDEDRDYYYSVVNKKNPKDIFVVSLKGINVIKPNNNNPPFQAQWDKSREPISRSWQEAKDYLLNTWADSIKKAIKIHTKGMPDFYPEYFQRN